MLAGELDLSPTPEQAAEAAALFPAAEVVVQPAAAHFPWVDDPAWFSAALADFPRSQLTRPSPRFVRIDPPSRGSSLASPSGSSLASPSGSSSASAQPAPPRRCVNGVDVPLVPF